MRQSAFGLVCAIIFAAVSTASQPALAQFEGMLSRVPLDANTLILIDADKLFGSPLADKEKWAARRKVAFEAGISALPPDATSVVLAARMEFAYGQNAWELALTRFANGRDVTAAAKRFGGSMDTIADRTAAKLPTEHYVVQISPTLLGSYTPADRQSVARWLSSTDKTSLTESMSPYLKTAYGYASKVGTPIVMAIDLGGVVSSAQALSRLKEFPGLEGHAELLEPLAKLAESVQGATLGITVGTGAVGAIRLDFAESPEAHANVLKPILLEVLKRQGAMVDDFASWQPSVQGNTFLLKGPLSTAGARRVLSVLELPPALGHAMEEASSANATGSGGPSPSQLYFQSITALLDDLREKPKKDGVQTTGQAAIWYSKYARKIDQLPVLDVDPTLLNFGADIAGGLRDAESALRGVGMRTAVRTMDNTVNSDVPAVSYGGGYNSGYGYGYGGYTFRYFDMRSGARIQSQQNAAIRTQERVSGVATVREIWKNIDEATAMIRREMTQKYEVEF